MELCGCPATGKRSRLKQSKRNDQLYQVNKMSEWWSRLSNINKLQIPIQQIARMAEKKYAAIKQTTLDIAELERMGAELQYAVARFKE
jgi:hypothetical protein